MIRDFIFFYKDGNYSLKDGPFLIKDGQDLISGEVLSSACGGYEVYISLECADWKEEDEIRRTAFGSGLLLVRTYLKNHSLWRRDFGQI